MISAFRSAVRGLRVAGGSVRRQEWTFGDAAFAQTLCTTTPEASESAEAHRKRLNKLRWRSHQRGLLEMDILIGKWSDQRLEKMDSATLLGFEKFLEEETPSLYKWVTDQERVPPHLEANPAFMDFYSFVREKIEANSVKESRNRAQAEWVRGWHDRGNQQ